jgi:hypothetical protein
MAAPKWYSQCPKAPEVQLMELMEEIEARKAEIAYLKFKLNILKEYRGMIREMHEKAVQLKNGILSIGTDEAVPVAELLNLVNHIIGCAWYNDHDPRK